jgi:hypothetical protein
MADTLDVTLCLKEITHTFVASEEPLSQIKWMDVYNTLFQLSYRQSRERKRYIDEWIKETLLLIPDGKRKQSFLNLTGLIQRHLH